MFCKCFHEVVYMTKRGKSSIFSISKICTVLECMNLLQLTGLTDLLSPPFDGDKVMRKQSRIKRELLAQDTPRITKRIAFLGGSTTSDIRNVLEIFLLNAGIAPEFYESEYNRYYEDSVFSNENLDAFNPEIIIIFTSVLNLKYPPLLTDSLSEIVAKIENEYARYKTMWDSLFTKYNAVIIQNNIDPSPIQPEGSGVLYSSLSNFRDILNVKFSEYAKDHPGFYIHDINRLASEIGLSRWRDMNQYYAYKLAVNYDVIPEVSYSLKRIICSVLGRVKKCLVLDLDNTLWGGVIGDDGVNGIIIGSETAQGEAYSEFQRYCKALHDRGIILAVCSKNDTDTAKSGFTHPDSILSLEDFTVFYANWEPKNVNIRRIAHEINIGLDSLVFIDDNPAERAIVRETMPEVSVPEVNPDDVFSFIRAIEINGYFDTVNISEDDRRRNDTYRQNIQRAELEHISANYDDFLQSLDMEAEITPFTEVYYDRIAQLTNKTNQFNLTTKRFTLAEIRAISEDERYITLCCRLKDRFGDNGIISLMIAEKEGDKLNIILWLMSCRVLKRGVEDVMINRMMNEAAKNGFRKVTGSYIPTKKNGMTANLYGSYGFRIVNDDESQTLWEIDMEDFRPAKNFIRIKGE